MRSAFTDTNFGGDTFNEFISSCKIRFIKQNIENKLCKVFHSFALLNSVLVALLVLPCQGNMVHRNACLQSKKEAYFELFAFNTGRQKEGGATFKPNLEISQNLAIKLDSLSKSSVKTLPQSA